MKRFGAFAFALAAMVWSGGPASAASGPQTSGVLPAQGAIVTAGEVSQPRLLVAQSGPDFWEVYGVSSGDFLNVRSGPGPGYKSLLIVDNGEVLRNLGCQGGGNSRWCKVQTTNGNFTGWASGRYLREASSGGGGGSVGVPEIAQRSSGEIEVRWKAGCTVLYDEDGRRIQAGGSCSRAQRTASDDAVKRYLREMGSGDDGGGVAGNLEGTGTFIGGGGFYSASVSTRNYRTWALIITAKGATCTGLLNKAPGSGADVVRIACTDGGRGNAVLGKQTSRGAVLMSFNMSGGKVLASKSGLVTLK